LLGLRTLGTYLFSKHCRSNTSKPLIYYIIYKWILQIIITIIKKIIYLHGCVYPETDRIPTFYFLFSDVSHQLFPSRGRRNIIRILCCIIAYVTSKRNLIDVWMKFQSRTLEDTEYRYYNYYYIVFSQIYVPTYLPVYHLFFY